MTRPVDPALVQALKDWFSEYCRSFSLPSAEDQRNISVKEEHTRQVCLTSVRIAADLKLTEERRALAEVIALFHDVGRFPQYRRYKTFDDSISVNHAALGAKTLLEQNVLGGLSKRDRDLVVHAVTLHNVFSLPAGLDAETLLHTEIVRDADKLDILRVVIEYFEQHEGSRADAVALGLPDMPGYSPEVLGCLLRGELVRKSLLRMQNDFKLLQLAWMYDLNFESSFQLVRERSYIDKLARLLPDTDEIRKGIDHVRTYVKRKRRNP